MTYNYIFKGKIFNSIYAIADYCNLTAQDAKKLPCRKILVEGESRKQHTLCKVYENMMNRCYNEKYHYYKNYGAKGLRVCQSWLDNFWIFIADMDNRPSKEHQLDRIDNSKGYSPNNCRWTTRTINMQNTSLSKRWFIKGKEFKSMTEAAKYFCVSTSTIHRWVNGRGKKNKKPQKQNCFSLSVY